MRPGTRLVAGVDLGKTSCRVRVVRLDGEEQESIGPVIGPVIGTVVVAGTRGLADPGGADAAAAAIRTGLAQVLPDRTDPLDVLAVGAAGREAAGPSSEDRLEERLAGLAGELVLTSDALISHAGAFSGGAGAVVAIGTGAVAFGLGPRGFAQVDGLGYWLGDDGGGAWIGRLGLRSALDARAGRGPATGLEAAATARYGDLARLPAVLAAGDQVAATTAAFAADVARAAEEGDAVALQILDAAGAALARTTAAATRESGTDRVAAVGGLVPVLVDRWRAHLPAELTVLAAAGSALDGAVLLATRRDLPHEPLLTRTTGGPAASSPFGGLDQLATEQVRADLHDLDERSPEQLVDVLLAAEASVPAAVAVARDQIAAAVSLAEKALLGSGRLIYVGAGTPGRLAAQDAAECPPTFGTAPGRVVALLGGGRSAGVRAVEGAEDDADAGWADVQSIDVGPDDVVVGISASGRTPYVLAALEAAHAVGAPTVAVVNNPGSVIARRADIAIELPTGPEVLAGSTRLKAGTSQKVVLNVISTCAMVRAGKTYGAWMVDVQSTNEKLRLRARRILREASGVSEDEARTALDAAGGHTRTALVMLLAGAEADRARQALGDAGGRVREAVGRLREERP